MLPDGSGVALCRSLRDAGLAVPILLLTARADVRDRVSGLDAGADDYLPKPFALSELAARVRALARRGPVPRASSVRVGNVTVDLERRRGFCGDRPAPLTAPELADVEGVAGRLGGSGG